MATYPYNVIWLADGGDSTVAARCKGVARGVGIAASAYELVVYGGDVYDVGSVAQFESVDGFDYMYGDNWNTGSPQGKFLIDKMAHVPGNHEYRTVDGSRRPSGMNTYWTDGTPARTTRSLTTIDTTRTDASPTINGLSGTTAQQVVNSDWSHFGYIDILDWRFVWLDTGRDSLIDETGAFPSAGSYYDAVAAVINAKTDRRLVLLSHFPRWTSSSAHPASESATGLTPLWNLAAAKAIAWFSGHVHHYERFSPLNAAGAVVAQASGCVEINAGNAGRSLTGFGTATTGSQVRDATIFGFCKLIVSQNSVVIEHWSCGTDGLQTPTLFDTVTLIPTTTLGGTDNTGSDTGSGTGTSALAASSSASDTGSGSSGASVSIAGAQTARPISDVSTGGWGATPLAPKTSDVSDATFITGTAGGGSSLGGSLPARMPASTGTNYYVSLSGSDANNGLSTGAPWRTLQHAFDNVSAAGSIINLRGGTWSSEGIAQWTRVASASNPVTVQPYLAESVVYTGQIKADVGSSGLRVNGKQRQLRMTGYQDAGNQGVLVTENAADVEFFEAELDHNGDTDVGGGRGSNAIYVGSSNAGGVSTNVQIIGCLIHHNGFSAALDHGIYYGGVFNGSLGATGGAVYNNVVYANAAFNMQLYAAADNLIVTNNTFDGAVGKSSMTVSGESAFSAQTDNSEVANNLLTNNQGGAIGDSDNGWGITNYQPGVGNRADNNLFYNNKNGNVLTDPGNLDEFNSTSADPLYVDRATGNFHVQTGSPAVGVGLSAYTPTFDFYGVARTQLQAGAIFGVV